MPGPAFLHDDRVELRTIEEEDLEFVRDHINDPEVWRTLGAAEPHNLKAEEEWFEAISGEDDGDVHLLICDDGEPVGSIGLHLAENWGLGELGYWVAAEHWGNGYCTAAVRLIAGYGFDHRRLHKLAADVYDHNPGSARVLEKVGFEREGVRREEAYVDGEYRDLLRYGLLEDELER